ncbi:MAG: substrate-binding domain-containing protein, partial [Microcystaceae cyanobacterium]
MKTNNLRTPIMAVAIALMMGLTACGGDNKNESPSENSLGIKLPFQGTKRIVGAGASFPAPLYKNWFVLLNQEVPQLQFDFQAVGSGAGIQQFTLGVIDFGASDIAMTDEQMAKISRGVLLLPMTAGSVVLAYNLTGVKEIKLPRDV